MENRITNALKSSLENASGDRSVSGFVGKDGSVNVSVNCTGADALMLATGIIASAFQTGTDAMDIDYFLTVMDVVKAGMVASWVACSGVSAAEGSIFAEGVADAMARRNSLGGEMGKTPPRNRKAW